MAGDVSGVVAGFTVIFVVIAVGYIVARTGVLGAHGEFVLGRTVFFVATPALLFDTLSTSDLSVVFSSTLAITAVSASAIGVLAFVVARVRRRPAPEATVAALSACYVNAANLGIPIAVFVLGDASFVAPLLLFQIMVLSPVALGILDVTTSPGRASALSIVAAPFTNPIVLAGLAGLALAVTGVTLPAPVAEPFALLGAVSVPGALLAFGMSLRGARVLQRDGDTARSDVLLAAGLKTVALPVLTYVLARWVWGVEGEQLFAVVVIASLPTAQNVFVYASRYGRGVVLARDTGFVTTVLAIPLIAAVAALLT